jgi:hypothetical protein
MLSLMITSYFILNVSTFVTSHALKDKDIQDALIGISRRLPKDCPTILIHDEQMPLLSVSEYLLQVLFI